ncbi:MAG TPA: hypothetical protein VEL76_21165 [Gemmataceae bacterium]|nr:hypothetical protein [Gemmataceae bacterium]
MIRYRVRSSVAVENDLALIWLQASDRDAVTRASNEIDQVLETAPLTRGIALDGAYSLTVAPLTVIYQVSPQKRLVTIEKFIYQG